MRDGINKIKSKQKLQIFKQTKTRLCLLLEQAWQHKCKLELIAPLAMSDQQNELLGHLESLSFSPSLIEVSYMLI